MKSSFRLQITTLTTQLCHSHSFAAIEEDPAFLLNSWLFYCKEK